MSERASPPSDGDPARSPAGNVAGDLERVRAERDALRHRVAMLEEECARTVQRETALHDQLHHQVRNMFAVVRSIFARTIDSSRSLEDVADHFRGRLDSLARFHIMRADTPQGVRYVEDMVRDELQIFEFDDRIEIVGPESPVPYDVVQPLALALHELTTNSIKYGALSRVDDRMRLHVGWTCAEKAIALVWQEYGVPVLAATPIRRGFGREFIEQALPYQLGAVTSFELKAGGLRCSIIIPLVAKLAPDTASRNWI